jgi:hypothetical protein
MAKKKTFLIGGSAKTNDDGSTTFRVSGRTGDDRIKDEYTRDKVEPTISMEKPKIDGTENIKKMTGNELSGVGSRRTSQGVDRTNTLGNKDIDHPSGGLKGAVDKAKDELKGGSNSDDNKQSDPNKSNDVAKDNGDASNNGTDQGSVEGVSDGPSEGLAWFSSNWETIAIAAGLSAIVAGIAKIFGSQIKSRYNKCVRTLQRAQEQFTTHEEGLNMRSVMSGVGSGIVDKVSNLFYGRFKKQSSNGNIGLRPFCQQYKNEIGEDFKTAQEAYNKIVYANNTNDSTQQNSSYGGKVYDSFYSAINSDVINEDVINEVGISSVIGSAMILGRLAVKAGSFLYQKTKDGKPDGEPKQIQVTKQSVREVCYAIINNFASKYLNMDQVFKKLGIETNSLSDLDKSSCDKLVAVLKKYQKPEANMYNKQYGRLYKAYNSMLKHYFNIGDGIIKNFSKYTEAKNEKQENLLVASKEKLTNLWDSQKDIYLENFSRIVTEIVSSQEYINYLNFIIEKVIPVFRTGLAGDADYILDIMPKRGERYVLRQTNDQALLNKGDVEKGQIAIAEVKEVDSNTKKITFGLIGLLKDNKGLVVDDNGKVTIKGEVITDAYVDDDGYVKEYTLEYSKWLSLDPGQTMWREKEKRTKVYIYRDSDKNIHFVYASASIMNKEKGYDTIYVGTINYGMSSVSKLTVINLTSNITDEGFVSVLGKLKYTFNVEDNKKVIAFIVYGIDNFRGVLNERDTEDIEGIVLIIDELLVPYNRKNVGSVHYIEHENRQLLVVSDVENENVKDVYITIKDVESSVISDVTKISIGYNIDINTFVSMLESGKDMVKFIKGNDSIKNIAIDIMDDTLSTKEEVDSMEKLKLMIIDFIKKLMGESKDKVDDVYKYIKEHASEVAKLIDEDINIKKDGVEYGEHFKGFPNIISPKIPFSVNLGVKDKDGKDVTINYMPVYKKGDKSPSIWAIGFPSQTNLTTYCVSENIKGFESAIVDVCDAMKNGKVVTYNLLSWLKNTIDNKDYEKIVVYAKAVSSCVDIKNNKIVAPNEYKNVVDVNGNNIKSKEFGIYKGDSSGNREDVIVSVNKVDNVINFSFRNNVILSVDSDKYDIYSVTNSLYVKLKDIITNMGYIIGESITVTYSHNIINEGICTNTIITRTFDDVYKKSYVLSESYFDIGVDASKLSSIDFVKNLKTRQDIFEYVKNNMNAKIYEFTETQTYNISSEQGYVPSLITPLYENVYAVKFDGDDIAMIKHIGKFKIY